MPASFDEILFDPTIFTDGDVMGGPEYANTMLRNPPTGVFKINITRFDFQQVWNFNLTLLNALKREYVMKIWGGGYGSGYGLRVRIFNDFYVIGQVLGISDGTVASKTWRLVKDYQRPGAIHKYTRRIIKPVASGAKVSPVLALKEADGVTPRVIPSLDGSNLGVPAFTIYLDDVAQSSGYTVDITTGIVTFTTAPTAGVVVSWSGEYDTPMRFMQNSIPMKAGQASEINGVEMVEIMAAEFGIT